MLWTILIALAIIASIGAFVAGAMFKDSDDKSFARVWGAVFLAASLVITGLTSIYSQSVGQASVLVNAGGTVAGQTDQPGFQLKAPWQTREVFDLFSQGITYAGSNGQVPKYTRGEVSGAEVTAAVKGGAQADFDLSVVYSLSGSGVTDLYHKYRSQERLVQQVVEPQILATIRKIPASYSPVEFRGEFRGEAQDRMLADLNANLAPYGITVDVVSLQNVTYTDDVEASIKAVEVANQELAKEEANLRAIEVSAQARVVEAQAIADANEIEGKSITENLLRQRWIDAIKESNGTIVVPDSAAPLIQVPSN